MRCSEARRRLIESRGLVAADDAELRQHLASCAECAAFACAEQSLSRDLAASTDDDTDDLPLSALKARVEARVDSNRQNAIKEIPFMSAALKQIRRRPSLGVTLGLAAVVLAFVTLVPFSFQNTVGYEVAIAGVDKNLAMDSDKVDELMTALGLGDVHVEVADCEQTCVLKLSALKDEGQVNIVVSAFDKLGNCIIQDVSEIHDTESASLLEQAHKKMFVGRTTTADGEDVYKFVIDALCLLDSTSGGAFGIWVTDQDDTLVICNQDSENSPRVITINRDSVTSRVFMKDASQDSVTCFIWNTGDSTTQVIGDCLPGDEGTARVFQIMGDCSGVNTSDDQMGIIRIKNAEGGNPTLVVKDRDGLLHELEMNDPDLTEKLKTLGVHVEVTDSEDGSGRTFVCRTDGSRTKVEFNLPNGENAADFEKAVESTPLPDGFELKQNYPNPFNPTTEIAFTIPEAQQVRLEVYNINGQKVRTLIDAVITAGSHTIEWDATDDSGVKVASGVYLYRLTAGDITTSKKMTLLK